MREMVLETCSGIKAHHVFTRPSRLLPSRILVNHRLLDLYTLLFAMSSIYIMVCYYRIHHGMLLHRKLHQGICYYRIQSSLADGTLNWSLYSVACVCFVVPWQTGRLTDLWNLRVKLLLQIPKVCFPSSCIYFTLYAT